MADLTSLTDKVIPDAGADFLRSEAAGGVALLIATVAALAWANGPFGDTYQTFWHSSLTFGFGSLSIDESLVHWVNDGLMTLFFFIVGLEIKRELVVGDLSDRRTAALPVLAAIGGAIVPALIFTAIVAGGAGVDGWAIPMATDIAFAISILALLGDRVSSGTRLLLLSIAIVDDILAITVIAIFYSTDISIAWLAAGLACLGLVSAIQVLGVRRILPYLVIGVVTWLCIFESGVHATLAGVALGLLTPARPIEGRETLQDLEHRLHPFTSFLVVPIFALANAGVVISQKSLSAAVADSVFWGILVGLVAGKVVGIAGTTALVRRLGIGSLPVGVGMKEVWGIAALGGIGFTVSLFIVNLSLPDETLAGIARLGIFAGSIFAAIIGTLLLIRPDSAAAVEAPRGNSA